MLAQSLNAPDKRAKLIITNKDGNVFCSFTMRANVMPRGSTIARSIPRRRCKRGSLADVDRVYDYGRKGCVGTRNRQSVIVNTAGLIKPCWYHA